MCGFVGFADSSGEIDKFKIIKDMMTTIVHRGPDSGSLFADDHVALGLRRLNPTYAVLYESQPVYNEDKSCVLVCDGEIYNDKELREALVADGHMFKNKTCSEVIMHGYETFGVNVLQKLRGMFSFSLWDATKQTLFLARDLLGIKPLYYTSHTTDQSFIFGSEIKSFLKHPSFRKELNKDALKPYLTFQYSVLDETFFKGVYKLKPGHYLTYRHGEIQVMPYWHVNFEEQEGSLAYYVEKINDTMKETVEAHRMNETKIGSFLSGGIDSSYITALLRPHKTFSIGFEGYEKEFDETGIAQDLCQQLNIENHRVHISAEQCFTMLPTIQYHMDEPQANLSSVPLYFLAELASKHVKVVLSGEGADEIFGGYHWYQKSAKSATYERLPYVIRRPISYISHFLPKNKVTQFLLKGGQPIEEKFIGQALVFTEVDALRILQDDYKKGPAIQSITKRVYDQVKREDDMTKMQYLDFHLWLPGDILLKADKMSMAHSLEVRIPFLDKHIMAVATALPSRWRINSKRTKIALREAAQAILPDAYANRAKLGFPVPIRHWLREEKYYTFVKDLFQSEMAEQFFNTTELMHYLDDHYYGKGNYARYIWTVYVFLIWYQRFFTNYHR